MRIQPKFSAVPSSQAWTSATIPLPSQIDSAPLETPSVALAAETKSPPAVDQLSELKKLKFQVASFGPAAAPLPSCPAASEVLSPQSAFKR